MWEHKWHIKTNVTKTKVLFLKPRKLPPYGNHYFNNFDRLQPAFQIISSCTILGLTFGTRFHHYIDSKAALA